ncbi:N-acetylmuramoyl-L-alanine amidase, partial [Dorea formicigenerans]|uniref:N-acetylmuramoyl-L-alanine amidase n=1 Tax=Dorea formicigenerans TaxID=39486 RepID=UPI00157011B8
MKKLFRVISCFMIAVILMTSLSIKNIYAIEQTEENKNSTVEETVIGQENTEEEINNEVQQEKGTESDEAFPDEESVGNSQINEEGSTSLVQAEDEKTIKYIYINQAQQEVGEQQNILVALEYSNAVQVELLIESRNEQEIKLKAVKNEENVYLFQNTFEKGTYYVKGVYVFDDNGENFLPSEDAGMNAYFSVGEECDAQKSEHIEMQSAAEDEDNTNIETSIVTIDENGAETTQDNIAEAMEEVGVKKQQPVTKGRMRSRAKNNSNIVVVLDPGHDAGHVGASGNGVREEIATLKIAQACKAELEQYSGVTVYMTREGSQCPYPETVGVKSGNILDIKKRVEWAATKGADVFISIHLNSATPAAKGAEVYYPSSSSDGKELAEDILNKLVALGLRSRGVKTNDEYAVVKNSIANGFPGLIIEHAFMTNSSDASNYLNSDDKLKKLGIADAEGIAQYFDLSKSPEITISNKDDFDGTADIHASGVGRNAKIIVTNQETGYSKEYALNGALEWTLNVDDYNGARGTYLVQAYNSSGSIVCKESLYFVKDTSRTLTVTDINKDERKYKIDLKFAEMPKEIKQVQFAVWSDEGGQDDLIWYDANQSTSGKWETTVDIYNHKTEGAYNVHTYVTMSDGRKRWVGTTGFVVQRPQFDAQIVN